MKILMVVNNIPYPPYTGSDVRIFNLIKVISQHCEISLACMSDNKLVGDTEYLRQFCKKIQVVPIVTDRNCLQKMLLFFYPKEWPRLFKRLIMLLQGVPFLVSSCYHFTFRDKLVEMLKDTHCDIIEFESMQTGQYISDLIPLIKDTKTVLVELAIPALEAKRLAQHVGFPKKIYYLFDSYLKARYEKHLLPKFDYIIAMSELEKQKLVELGLHSSLIVVIKSGVDTEQYWDIKVPNAKHNIVFLGSMKLYPNREGLCRFLDNVFPLVRKKVENATLLVIGKEDPKITNKYASKHVIFRGIVKNLEEEMGEGMLFITPVRIGAGTRLKIVTAMAFGMPVVTTSVGIEGIEATEENGVILEDTEKGFADAIINLLEDDQRRSLYGRKARIFVEDHYSWNAISKKLLRFYNSILQDK